MLKEPHWIHFERAALNIHIYCDAFLVRTKGVSGIPSMYKCNSGGLYKNALRYIYDKE